MLEKNLVYMALVHKLLSMKEILVGAVGIELKAALKTRKLLIPLNEKNAKNIRFGQVRYTAGTRNDRRPGEEHGT